MTDNKPNKTDNSATNVAKITPIEEKTTKVLDNPLDALHNIKIDKKVYKETGMFDIPEEHKDPRFAYAFPLISQVGEKQKKGWHLYSETMSKAKDIEGRVGSAISFFGSLDDELKELGHIVMIKTKDSYNEEKEYIQKQTDRQEESIATDAKNIKGNYGEITKDDKTKIKL